MVDVDSQPRLKPLRPHSRTFRRGALGDLDGRSRAGRFLRAVETDLSQHVGGAPTTTQKILINRCAKLMLRLDVFDERLTDGDMTSHDARTYNALQNSLRLSLRDLGLKDRAEKPPQSLKDYLASKAAAKPNGEAVEC